MDYRSGHLLSFGSGVGVKRGGFSGVVTEILLDQAEVDTRFQEVCSVRMPQRMNRGFLREAALAQG
jgi:hypothetical protein